MGFRRDARPHSAMVAARPQTATSERAVIEIGHARQRVGGCRERRARFVGLALAVPLLGCLAGHETRPQPAPPVSVAVDDTFSCFDEFHGPVIKAFSGDQGYVNVRIKDWSEDYSRIDARGAIFRQEHYLLSNGGGTNPDQENLVVIGGAWRDEPRPPLCWVGGQFIGSTDLGAGYRDVKENGGSGLLLNSNGGVIDGVRLHNIHEDALKHTNGAGASRRPHKTKILRNSWISLTKASFLENDHVANLLVDDVLVDGSFNGLSTDPGGKYSGGGVERDNEVTISNSLIRLLKVPGSQVSSKVNTDYLIWIKPKRGVVPKFKIYNTIFATDGWPEVRGQSNRQQAVWENMTECSNNVIAWMSDSPLPYDFPMPPSECFTIVEGQEARALWDAAKQNWIDCHPKLERLPEDPASDYARCDRTAYGGGGAPMPARDVDQAFNR